MKKVLIVTPNWPPISCPDIHRVRMSLPFFSKFEWEPLILKINPDEQMGIKDELLTKTIPLNTKVWQAGCVNNNITRWFGIHSIGIRSLFHLAKLGSQIIETSNPDLVFFSTTMFITTILGRYWYIKYGIPYVIDFQDPWVSDYYFRPNSPKPPGGYFKYYFSQLIAKQLESTTLRKVSHIISVSPNYPKTFLDRYRWLSEGQFTILPFGAPESDFEQLPSLNIKQTIFDRHDGKKHWVYVGVVGNIMSFALRTLFMGIQSAREQNPAAWESIELHFVGTSYAPGDRSTKTVEPIAVEYGVADIVKEYSHRLPYFEALQIMVDSDGILLIGSNDPGYTASKLYPCILARKPILAVFHEQSSVVDILDRCNAGKAVTFKAGDRPQDLTPQILTQLQWLQSLPSGYQPGTDWQALQPYTAKEMTRKQCEVFDRVVSQTVQKDGKYLSR
jgi:hypothetical protein